MVRQTTNAAGTTGPIGPDEAFSIHNKKPKEWNLQKQPLFGTKRMSSLALMAVAAEQQQPHRNRTAREISYRKINKALMEMYFFKDSRFALPAFTNYLQQHKQK